MREEGARQDSYSDLFYKRGLKKRRNVDRKDGKEDISNSQVDGNEGVTPFVLG